MPYHQKDCVAYLSAVNPMLRRTVFGKTTVAEALGMLQEFDATTCPPEGDAAKFYLHSHALAELQRLYEPEQLLPAPLLIQARLSLREMNALYLRNVMYLFMICVREARHWNKGPHAEMQKKYGKKIAYLHDGFPDQNSIKAVRDRLLSAVADEPFADVVQCTRDKFYEKGWGHSYGGLKWGAVADALAAFVAGRTSAQVLVDASWAMEHNTAGIFNKGMLYDGQNALAMRTLLDVQRSGQVPQMMNMLRAGSYEKIPGGPYLYQLCGGAQAALASWQEAGLRGSFDSTAGVDWAEVVRLGALGNYGALTSAPASGKKPNKNYVEIMPDLWVQTVKRPKGASALMAQIEKIEVLKTVGA